MEDLDDLTDKMFNKTSTTIKNQVISFTKESGKMAALSIAWIIISVISTDSTTIEESLKFMVAGLLTVFGIGLIIIFLYFNGKIQKNNKRSLEVENWAISLALKHKETTEKWAECIEERFRINKEREELKILMEILRIELNRAYLELIKDKAEDEGKQRVKDKAAKEMRRVIRNAERGL